MQPVDVLRRQAELHGDRRDLLSWHLEDIACNLELAAAIKARAEARAVVALSGNYRFQECG